MSRATIINCIMFPAMAMLVGAIGDPRTGWRYRVEDLLVGLASIAVVGFCLLWVAAQNGALDN